MTVLRIILLLYSLACPAVLSAQHMQRVTEPAYDADYNSSTHVFLGRPFHIDTSCVQLAPAAYCELPEAVIAYPGRFNSDSFQADCSRRVRRYDSIEIAAERVRLQAEKRAHRHDRHWVMPPPETHLRSIVTYPYIIIRCQMSVRDVYKTSYDYTNPVKHSRLANGDTATVLFIASDPSNLRGSLSGGPVPLVSRGTDYLVYYSDAYYSKKLPAPLRNRALADLYARQRMFWVEPARFREDIWEEVPVQYQR